MYGVHLTSVLLVVAGAVGLAALVALPFRLLGQPERARRMAALALLVGSVVVALGVTHAWYVVQPSLWHDWGSVNLVPFATIQLELNRSNRDLGLLNVVGNVVLFAPIGLFAVLSGRFRVWTAILAGTALSVLIEVSQFLVGRSADVDDVLLNFAGTAAGAVVAGALLFLAARRRPSLPARS